MTPTLEDLEVELANRLREITEVTQTNHLLSMKLSTN